MADEPMPPQLAELEAELLGPYLDQHEKDAVGLFEDAGLPVTPEWLDPPGWWRDKSRVMAAMRNFGSRLRP